VSIDRYLCAQCSWFADGSKAGDQADVHYRSTRHVIDEQPSAETDYSGYTVIDLDEELAPDARAAERQWRADAFWRAQDCDAEGRWR
jgi:hypothetical protein